MVKNVHVHIDNQPSDQWSIIDEEEELEIATTVGQHTIIISHSSPGGSFPG